MTTQKAASVNLGTEKTGYYGGIVGAAKNRQDSYKQYILGLVGGFYPTPWRGDVMSTAARSASNWKSKQEGQFGSGWAKSMIEVKGINYYKDRAISKKIQFDGNAMWPLGGNPAWYMGLNDYGQAKEDFESTIKDHRDTVAGRTMMRGFIAGLGGAEMMKTAGQPTDPLWELTTEGIAASQRGLSDVDVTEDLAVELLVQKVLDDYRNLSGKWTQSYLTGLNRAAQRHIRGIADISDPGEGSYRQKLEPWGKPGKTYTITEGADVREEETGMLQSSAISPKEASVVFEDTYGATKKTDTIFRMGGKFWFQEVTEQTLDDDSGHHGISKGGLMGKEEIDKLLADGAKGKLKLRRKILTYFQGQQVLYNEAIKGIKDITTRQRVGKYGTGIAISPEGAGLSGAEKLRGPVTIEAMMKGPGGKSRPMATVTHPGAGGWSWQKRRAWLRKQRELGKSLSVANRTVLGLIGEQYKRDINLPGGRVGHVDNEMVKFVNHALGNFGITGGKFFGGYTVSKDPHTTASILFQMFKEGHDREFEFQDLKNIRSVQIWEGYVTLARLIDAGLMTEGEYTAAVFGQGVTHSVNKLLKGVTDYTINTVSDLSKASIGKNLRTGFRIVVPDQVGQVAMAKIHAKLASISGREGIIQNMNFGTQHQFGRQLRSTQEEARDNQSNRNQTYTYGSKIGYGTFKRFGSGEPSPYPNKTWISAAPYIGLQIVKPGIESKKRD